MKIRYTKIQEEILRRNGEGIESIAKDFNLSTDAIRSIENNAANLKGIARRYLDNDDLLNIDLRYLLSRRTASILDSHAICNLSNLKDIFTDKDKMISFKTKFNRPIFVEIYTLLYALGYIDHDVSEYEQDDIMRLDFNTCRYDKTKNFIIKNEIGTISEVIDLIENNHIRNLDTYTTPIESELQILIYNETGYICKPNVEIDNIIQYSDILYRFSSYYVNKIGKLIQVTGYYNSCLDEIAIVDGKQINISIEFIKEAVKENI